MFLSLFQSPTIRVIPGKETEPGCDLKQRSSKGQFVCSANAQDASKRLEQAAQKQQRP